MDKKLTALITALSLSAALAIPASAYSTYGDTTNGGAPVRGNMVNNPIERMTDNLERDLTPNGYSGNGYQMNQMNVPNMNNGKNMFNNGTNNNETYNKRNTMRSNSMYNRSSTDNYNTTGKGNYRTNTVRAQSTTSAGSNWGWLGLLGLFGLAGMRKRESDRV